MTTVALIFMLIGVFLCQDFAYSADDSHLRVPLGIDKIRQQQALKELSVINGSVFFGSYFDFIKRYSPKDEASFESTWDLIAEEKYVPLLRRLIQVAKIGGIGVSVGPEQNLGLISAIDPELWIIIDISRVVTEIQLPGIFALTERASTPEEYAALFSRSDEAFWNQFAEEVYPKDLQARAKDFWDDGDERNIVLESWFEEGNWLSSLERYEIVKKAWREGRIKAISGDWGKQAPKVIASLLKNEGKSIKVFYQSNLASWRVSPDLEILENLEALPREEISFVIDRDLLGSGQDVFRLYDLYLLKYRYLLGRSHADNSYYYLAYGLEQLSDLNSGGISGNFKDALYMLRSSIDYFEKTFPESRAILKDTLIRSSRYGPLGEHFLRAINALVETGHFAFDRQNEIDVIRIFPDKDLRLGL